MKIRSKTISYATMKKRDEENEKELENSIQCLESKLSLTEDEKGKLENNRQALTLRLEKKRWREFYFAQERDGLLRKKK